MPAQAPVTIHIETLNVHAPLDPSFVSSLVEQLRGGTGAEQMRETGFPVVDPEDSEAVTGVEDAAEAERARMEAIAETTEPIAEHIKPHTRASHLYKAMTIASKLRRIRGAITTSQETSLKSRYLAEDALEGYSENLTTTLARACGACAYSGRCRYEGNPEAWLRVHPDERKVTTEKQESIQAFTTRLDINSMAHCAPPGTPRKPIVQR